MIIRVPGSSANLGPGFDALGLAVGLHARVGTDPVERPDGAHVADEHHPATIAYRQAGGRGSLWVQPGLPMGRGLGYSGAVRAGGALAALLERDGDRVITDAHRAEAVAIGTRLEGHADNVAASVHGGVVVAAGGAVVRIPLGVVPALVVWIPSFTTSTDSSRARLPADVPFADAVFNVGRVALLVAALAAGRPEFLGTATQDRLHQAIRFEAAGPSRDAVAAALGAGAWAAWLSGSGPTVAAFCDPGRAEAIVAALPGTGTARLLAIDDVGAVVEG